MPAADPVPGWARNMGRCDNMAAAAGRLCAMMERSGRAGGGRAGDGTGQAGEPHAGRVGGQGRAHEAGLLEPGDFNHK